MPTSLHRLRSGLVGWRIDVWGVVVGALALVPVVQGYVHRTHINDDSFITFTYARSLADGNGFRVNGGPPVLGTTSPLWALLVAVISRLVWFVSIPTLASLLSGMCWSGVVVLMYRSRERWGLSSVQAALYCSVIVSGAWVLNFGMEAMGFAFLLTASVCSFLSGRLVHAGVSTGLLALTRGEGVIVCVLIILWHIMRERGGTKFRERSVSLVVAMAAPLLLWTAYSLAVFGSPIPTTLSAKRYQLQSSLFQSFASRLWNSWIPDWPDYLRVHGISPWWPLIVVGLADIAFRHRTRVVWLVWGVAYALAYTAIGTAGYWWYQLPLLYIAYHVLASGVVAVVDGARLAAHRATRNASAKTPPLAPALATGAIVAVLLVFLTLPAVRRSDAVAPDARHAPYRAAGEWLREFTPAGSTVAAVEVGFISYYSERPVVDLAGLLTPDIGPHLSSGDFAWGVWAHRPDYYVRLERFDGWFARLHEDPCFQTSYKLVADMPGLADDRLLIYRRVDGVPTCSPAT